MKSFQMLSSVILMKRILFVAGSSSSSFARTTAFVVPRHDMNQQRLMSSTTLCESNIPSIEELSTDPFMKQVQHASTLVPLLNDKDSNVDMYPMLKAQLSHSDGIRGFFVSYLTGSSEEEEEEEEKNMVVPKSLRRAMKKVDAKELVPLACMNVIMPTAMVTMHTDPNLSSSSAKTAKRGKVILSTLLQDEADGEKDDFLVLDNCLAMLEAADAAINTMEVEMDDDDDDDDEGDDVDEELVKYWQDFYVKWGYKETQLNDIITTISEVLA
mmetsp:Transcript_11976/g.17730  ORF Transcript_11976/g.17730 Transcript_11976/m.17730 type:complete len:270 (-) Transcript_11976:34-843(-)